MCTQERPVKQPPVDVFHTRRPVVVRVADVVQDVHELRVHALQLVARGEFVTALRLWSGFALLEPLVAEDVDRLCQVDGGVIGCGDGDESLAEVQVRIAESRVLRPEHQGGADGGQLLHAVAGRVDHVPLAGSLAGGGTYGPGAAGQGGGQVTRHNRRVKHVAGVGRQRTSLAVDAAAGRRQIEFTETEILHGARGSTDIRTVLAAD